MELKRIDVAGIRPNENNPRADFGDLDALWESFALNTANPGEPVNPIVVVADGPVYRIVDGERRYRAMSDHGQESCMAVVCDGYDDMAQAVQMLATDDKLSLTPEEAGQGIQQMLLLGVDVERVAAASKAPAESVRAVRRVLRCRQGEGVFQATLDQMLAVADVDENGDGDLADEMLSDRNWRQSYDKFKREQRHRQEYEEYCAAALDAGFELLPEGFNADEYGPVASSYSVDRFPVLWEKGYRFASVTLAPYGASADVYMPKDAQPGKTAEELEAERRRAEEKAAVEDVQRQFDRLKADVARWWAETMVFGSSTVATNGIERIARKALFGEGGELAWRVGEFCELSGKSRETISPEQLTWELKACGFVLAYEEPAGIYTLARANALGIEGMDAWGLSYAVEQAKDQCANINQFTAIGYEPPEWADALMRKVEEVAGWKIEDEDEEEGTDEDDPEDMR